MTTSLEDQLRDLAPQVLGAMVRRHSSFEACEDAVQEALLAAATQWPTQGIPEQPRAWLITVANRRLTDQMRSEGARRRREAANTPAAPSTLWEGTEPDDVPRDFDDTLTVLFLCCHPSLSTPSQMALTLRSVGGLTTAEIAQAFLVSEPTMTRRLSRAHKQLSSVMAEHGTLEATAKVDRLGVVLHVLYLIFNEGYASALGPNLQRRDLATEAIRLTRLLHRLAPDEAEAAGLLALMLLTDARHLARTAPDGSMIPIADQDRSMWDRARIDEGVTLLLATLSRGRVGSYQVQAAIAGVHCEAPRFEDTDWLEILGLYRLLSHIAPSPVLTLNQVVAELEVNGVDAATSLLATLNDEPTMVNNHRMHVVRAHVLERAGDFRAAAAEYSEAARRASSIPEQRYLHARAAELAAREPSFKAGSAPPDSKQS
ncbi:MAG TPA: DUF6596 domain-containing protein [Microthrixaceae bacterium]|nr:DUF6596 domain-containing protein [Microthrixaceae bacterium]